MRPPARPARRTRMDDGRPDRDARDRRLRRRKVERVGIGGDAQLGEQAAPAADLVLVGSPFGHPTALGDIAIGEGEQPPWTRREQNTMAGRAAAVEVDGHVGAIELARQRYERLRVDDAVDRSAEKGERRELAGRGEDAFVLGEGGGERPQGGNDCQQVAEPEGAQGDEERPLRYGHEDSRDGVTTSSRTSHVAGCERTKTTAEATSFGSARSASGGGLYFSSRPSKKAVCMPPGTSIVTPIPPAVS